MPKLLEHPFVPLHNPDFPSGPEVVYDKHGSHRWFKQQVILLKEQAGANVLLRKEMFIRCTEIAMAFLHVDGQKINRKYLSYFVDSLVAERCFPNAKFPVKDPDPIFTRIFNKYMKEEVKLRAVLTTNKNTKRVIDQELTGLAKTWSEKLAEARAEEAKGKLNSSQTTSADETTDPPTAFPFLEEYVVVKKDQCINEEQSELINTFMETLGEDVNDDSNAENTIDG
ncbi:hypothetical protein MFRU_018g01070 [Monilinia fructicola]|uniref:Uncharacterized protein n=1 Tax=Monilinia fructicola TaxID=38448 RepID=A0A5M9JS57_MONFR|nr:hypothetical protein EYC84_002016 [Monilinia fructicola]KAG4029001.1 hypothetical protein MFRU_018g01070 [Monilinia fructicola]